MKEVSIIIPLRNEEKYLDELFESLKKQEINHLKLEYIFIDGCSEDNTQKILFNKINELNHKSVVLVNPKKQTPSSLNMGIHKASGEFIIRMDGHSIYPKEYIQRLVDIHLKYDCQNCGGTIRTIPSDNKFIIPVVISEALSSKFCVGDSKFRTENNKQKKIIEVDTVPFGCFKRDLLILFSTQ